LSNNDFIGRGEMEVKQILQLLFPKAAIGMQVPLERLISTNEFLALNDEVQKHKFDLVVYNGPNIMVIEVNYKHKEKAAQKWSNIFVNLIVNANKIPITIDDYNCEHLFTDSETAKKKKPWGSYIDVIRELERQGIKPDGSLL